MKKPVSRLLKELSLKLDNEAYMEKCANGEAYLTQRIELPDPYPVEKLTIEIQGSGKNIVSSKVRVFADGKQLGLLRHLSLNANVDSPFVDLKMEQSAIRFKKGEKVIPYNATPKTGEVAAKAVKALGREGVAEMVPYIITKPIEINWIKSYDKLRK